MGDSNFTSLKVGKRETLYKGRILELIEESVTHPDGRVYTHTSVTHPGAVVIIPKVSDDEVLMVRQYRHSVGRTLLEFPAGTLEPGEDPRDCAQREIQEEVKHGAKTWVGLGTIFPAPGFCSEKQHLYFATDLYSSEAALDEDEILNCETIRLSEIEELIDSGKIEDGKSIAIFMRARLKGLL